MRKEDSYLPGYLLGESYTVTREDFGDDFHWGVASCAFQTEGSPTSDGKGVSIWDRFTTKKRAILNGDKANYACDFYNLYRDDIQRINYLNFKAFRTSIAWTRILPTGRGLINTKGLDYYDRMIDFCLKCDVDPWLTLYHWDLPQALQDRGGWKNRDIISWFSDYVDKVTRKYGDRVKNWMVLNEPLVFTALGYLLGIHAPGLRGLSNFFPAVHHATMCQAAGGKIIRSNVKHSYIGTTFSCAPTFPYKETVRSLNAAKRADVVLNRLYIEPVLGMGYPSEDFKLLQGIESYMKAGDDLLLPFDFDFIGIQNYTREVITFSITQPYGWMKQVRACDRRVPVTEMGWEVYPPSIYLALKQFSNYEGVKAIIVTENGAAFKDTIENGKVYDKQRQSFIMENLEQIWRAKKEGVNVKGYFCWTLLDNFEWAEGFKPRFGLIHVNHKTQERIIKESGYWFKDFLSN
ncbi:MAG: GH1 family beta-glucosidase [Cytophagaceae bacterium]